MVVLEHDSVTTAAERLRMPVRAVYRALGGR
jgi:hypothetical protein